MTRFGFGIVCGALLLAVGCNSGQGLPRTYPARGQVLYQNGQPMKGGSVEFTTAEDNSLKVFGQIQKDGKFTLTTMRDRAKVSGAPAGEYRVQVLPPLQGEHKGVPPIRVPGTYKVEAKDDNQFAIQLNVSPP